MSRKRSQSEESLINTHCIRCNSPDTSHWRVDTMGFVKFYCENCWQDWLVDKELVKNLPQTIPNWLPDCLSEALLFYRSHQV